MSVVVEILASSMLGILAVVVKYLYQQWLGVEPQGLSPTSYKERMTELTGRLVEASADIDRVLQEIAEVSRQREAAITQLERQIESLSDRERLLQEKVDMLEKVPLPVIEHFAEIAAKGEKRSALRDYALFVAGVIVSALMAVLLG